MSEPAQVPPEPNHSTERWEDLHLFNALKPQLAKSPELIIDHYFARCPWYDRTCINETIKMQTRSGVVKGADVE